MYLRATSATVLRQGLRLLGFFGASCVGLIPSKHDWVVLRLLEVISATYTSHSTGIHIPSMAGIESECITCMWRTLSAPIYHLSTPLLLQKWQVELLQNLRAVRVDVSWLGALVKTCAACSPLCNVRKVHIQVLWQATTVAVAPQPNPHLATYHVVPCSKS